MLALNHKLQTAYEETFVCKEQKVLFEEVTTINNKKYIVGHNERYLKIAVPTYETNMEHLLNTICHVKIENILEANVLLGKIG